MLLRFATCCRGCSGVAEFVGVLPECCGGCSGDVGVAGMLSKHLECCWGLWDVVEVEVALPSVMLLWSGAEVSGLF